MIRLPIYSLLLVGLVTMVLSSSSVQVGAQTGALTFHDLAAMPKWRLGTTMQARGAMGKSASFALADMPPGQLGRAGTTHFHTQEQIVLGLKGSTVFYLGGGTYRLGAHGAVVTPPDVEHSQVNGSLAEGSTFAEFQGVLRSDWFPPRSTYASRKAPAPSLIAPSDHVFEDFAPSSEKWSTTESGPRFKVLSGRSISVTLWDLSGTMTSVALASTAEQFVFVVEGQARISSGAVRRELPAEMLVIVAPSTDDVRLRASTERSVVAVFEAGSR